MLMTLLLVATYSWLVSSLPIPQTGFPPPQPDTKFYLLRLQTLPRTLHPELDGLYLESYHTGAGLGDVTFNTSTSSPQGFLNGTRAQFDLSSQTNGYIPWTLVMTDAPYATFSPAEINVGLEDFGAFYFNQTASGSLWWNIQGNSTDPYFEYENNSFAGWLACNWVHQDLPQLFWLNSYYAARSPLPANCAPIYLIPEYQE